MWEVIHPVNTQEVIWGVTCAAGWCWWLVIATPHCSRCHCLCNIHCTSPGLGPIHLTFLTINNLLNNVGLTSRSIANTFTSCNWIKKLLFNLSLKSVTISSCIVDLSKSSEFADRNSLHLAISESEYWDQLQCQDRDIITVGDAAGGLPVTCWVLSGSRGHRSWWWSFNSSSCSSAWAQPWEWLHLMSWWW